MNSFIYENTTRVYFGEHQLGHLGQELALYGKKVLFVYGGGSIKKNGLHEKVIAEIKKVGLEFVEFSGVEPNPQIALVNAGATICKNKGIDVLLAVGGGSVIDCAKNIGVATFYDGDAWDLVDKKVEPKECLPIVTILTLAATGSEMNAGGVISNIQTREKKGLFFPAMRPKVSFLDPTLTYTVDAYQTACGAADTMSHIMEVYFNMNKGLHMLDSMMESMMKTVFKYAPIAIEEPTNYEARANLMWAASWAMNGLINGGRERQSWSCHPMGHQLSVEYNVTHGHALAILTPRWMEYCLDEKNVSKYAQFAINAFGIKASLPQMEIAKRGIKKFVDFFFVSLGLKGTLSELGIDNKKFSEMAKRAEARGTQKAFKPLYANDIERIFEMCL